MFPYLTAVVNKKTKESPPTSARPVQGNLKKTKLQQTPLVLPTRPADKKKEDKDKDAPSGLTNHSPKPALDPQAAEWQPATSKNARNMGKKKKQAKAATDALLSESDSDSEEENSDNGLIIPEQQSMFISDQSINSRYTITLEIDTTLDPASFLKASITKLNKALKRLTTDGQLAGYSGKAVVIPWNDSSVYSNRAWIRIKRSMEHTQLLPFVRAILYGYGAPKARKQDIKLAKKYCRINIAWMSTETFSSLKLESLKQFLSHVRIIEPESFSVYPAPTPAINPTIAVQFRNSALVNNSNWSDRGHKDCLIELNDMIKSFLPPSTIAGLKKVTFATGQNFMRGDPSMLSLECEKSDERTVTRDILQAFRSINRKTQIRDKSSVPWIAVPYFKGTDIQSNQKYLAQYVDIKSKEAVYQSGIMMKYVDHIHALDTVASPHFFLSKEFLKQLEQDIWNRNETPIQALIYDKLWDETYQELLQNSTPTGKKKLKISFDQVLDAMAKKGYPTLAPYDEESFPTPNPSTRTLREYMMTMKSRRVTDASDAPFVFESINNTDDGRVLFTFSQATMEEATTILECLPLMIQHEMHLDPSCFLTLNFMKLCQGNYYNPLSRTGVTAVAACLTDEVKMNNNPKHRIPHAIRSATAQEIEHIFKRTENKMFTFHDDSDLASIANSIASHKLPDIDMPRTVEQISNLQTLLQTHHLQTDKDEEMSALSDSSNLSFDSKASKNCYEIERRADQMANKKVDESMYQMKVKQGLTLLQTGTLTAELARQLELPYEDIVTLFRSSNPTEDALDEKDLLINPLTSELPDSDAMDESSDDEAKSDNMSESDNNSSTDDPDADECSNQNKKKEMISDSESTSENYDSDTHSDDTPVRGSPNKTTVAGGQNPGTLT